MRAIAAVGPAGRDRGEPAQPPGRTVGKSVGGNPSRVRISYPPQVSGPAPFAGAGSLRFRVAVATEAGSRRAACAPPGRTAARFRPSPAWSPTVLPKGDHPPDKAPGQHAPISIAHHVVTSRPRALGRGLRAGLATPHPTPGRHLTAGHHSGRQGRRAARDARRRPDAEGPRSAVPGDAP